MLRILAVVALLITAGVAFFVFYHPPMRLMPAPLLFQKGGDQVFDLAPDLKDGAELRIFYGTSRLPVGPRSDRVYTVAPDRRLHVGKAMLRIGDEDSTLYQLREWTTGLGGSDRPFINLTRMDEFATIPSGETPGPEAQAWFAEINAALAQSRDKDILIYVHGANTTVERAAGQASQLRHFSGRNAVVVLFAWPTAENFLRYSKDIQNAFGSAPHLAEMIGLLTKNTNAEKINVVTYSAGATVGSEGLALLARDYPETAGKLGEVYHAAPDADFRGFVDDLDIYARHVDRVTTAVNLGDSALRLAGVVNRASRAGRPDLSELSPEAANLLLSKVASDGLEILQVHPDTMPNLSSTSHTFWYDDPWVSNDLLVALLTHLTPAERQLDVRLSPSGARYWTFPMDYPERMPALTAILRARMNGEKTAP